MEVGIALPVSKWLLNEKRSQPFALLLSALMMSGGATATIAQPMPQPSGSGDYYRNEAPRRATDAPAGLSPGSLWQVVTVGLNCRQSPTTGSPIMAQFAQGDILQVEVYRGGSDEVLLNAKDANGKPWMPVRRSDGVCYVRANQRYIQPLEN